MRVSREESGRLKYPGDLSQVAIGVIALEQLGVQDTGRIAKLLRVDRGRLAELIDAIHTSRSRMLRRCLAEGLPPGLRAHLAQAQRVRCMKCGGLINLVPCVRCRPRDESRVESPGFFVPPAPPQATQAMPGSFKKQRIFQSRLARGEALFHEGDLAV